MTRALVALVVSLTVVFARPAAARPRPTVRVFVAADAPERAAWSQLIRELLEPLGVAVRISPAPRIERARVASAPEDASGEAAIAFIDALGAGRATLYLVDTERERVYLRSVPRSPERAELAREELGHILETAVEGVLLGEAIGVPRRTAFPPPAPPRPEPSPRWQAGFELGVLYEAQYLSDQVLLSHGPLLAGGFALRRGRWRVGALASAQYRQPLHAHSALVSARLEGAALRVLATLAHAVTPSVDLRAGLGGGADVVRVEPESRDEARAEVEDARTLSYGVIRTALGIDWHIGRGVALLGWLGADVDPSGTRYVFATRTGEENVLIPAAIRPMAVLGLGFH